uniref:Zinc finger, CCHC-type n=1 Tax=Tanacetum cinerariifolium TaxID=118510 RepID=A0A6L2MY16_TANCI|nr:zinc finger, CCHC-type [Tanacetum cinerariifolium]
MSFEEAIRRLTAYEERIKSQDTLEANDQDKLLMASSNNKTYGKWRGKDFNKEGKDSMKWKNNPNARRASTSQGIKDKSKLRCYECEIELHVFEDMYTSFDTIADQTYVNYTKLRSDAYETPNKAVNLAGISRPSIFQAADKL